MKKDRVFAKGFFVEHPRPGAPSFVKGRISIKAPDAIAFINANANASGYVNLDLQESTDGTKMYLALNDWKPGRQEEVHATPMEDGILPEEVPF